MRFHANGVDAGVGPAAACHLLERVDHVHFLVVEHLGAPLFLRHAHAVVVAIDGDHALGAQ